MDERTESVEYRLYRPEPPPGLRRFRDPETGRLVQPVATATVAAAQLKVSLARMLGDPIPVEAARIAALGD